MLWINLFKEIENSNKTLDKLRALEEFFTVATDEDKLWVIALFTSRRPKKPVNTKQMRFWATELAGIPDWMFEECYGVVGDLSETISLIVTRDIEQAEISLSLAELMTQILEMALWDEERKKQYILGYWKSLDVYGCFIFNKLLSGGFRLGVSQQLLVQALSKVTGQEAAEITHRLTGNWQPGKITYHDLILNPIDKTNLSKPYPFYLAYALDAEPEALGNAQEWLAEYKWDGIRCQLIKRKGEVFIWSRGEELITSHFPELALQAASFPDGCVIDGELLAYNETPLPFALLQKRIAKKKPSAALIKSCPCIIMAYDLLEFEGNDFRHEPIMKRRVFLNEVLSYANENYFKLSPQLNFNTWDELAAHRADSRAQKAEGVMIKSKSSIYESGRKRGNWWKWKVDPFSIDAVLVYAQKGHGKRANLYTDYTFALWHEGKLITIAKAYSGLTNKEILEVDQFVKKNTLEKFGPVRTVKPELVFEIGFEGMQESSRHKSGVALRFPRIIRWRTDKKIEEANTLYDLKALL